ncbi:hypothetical protein ACIRO1_23730 [Streptomyces sp. NPDC102381]|uniref:hypothetical protein n=1 Tax=Streptomyces sp. NPDC102381 TaxID=3366164 RepID=UPI00381DAD4C
MTGHEPPIPDEEWRKFLTDSEHAIRRTAPREPSAHERAASSPAHEEPVGELWTPKGHDPVRRWHDLSRRERSRRCARLVGAVTTLIVFLVVAGRDQEGGPLPDDRPGGVMLQESGASPGVTPTAAATP